MFLYYLGQDSPDLCGILLTVWLYIYYIVVLNSYY